MTPSSRFLLPLAWILFLGLVFLSAMSGAVSIDVLSPETLLTSRGELTSEGIILLKIRLPRIIMAALTGMGLTLGGIVFQALFRNPMAEPYILGISSGAALGASLVALLGINVSLAGISALGVGAFAGAGLSLLLLYVFIWGPARSQRIGLLLGGVVLSFFFSSLMSLILSLDRELASSLIFWSMGSFTTAGWEKVLFLTPLLLFSLVMVLAHSHTLNLLTAGEAAAQTLGVNVERTRNVLLLITSLLTAAVVACVGTVGFVGLLVPHGIRLLTGANHRRLIPLSLPAGASLMILADLLARRLVPPMEIPVGVITGLLGAPLFLFLLRKTSGYRLEGS